MSKTEATQNTWFDLDVKTRQEMKEWIKRNNSPAISKVTSAGLRTLIHLPEDVGAMLLNLDPTHPTYQAAIEIVAAAMRRAMAAGVEAARGLNTAAGQRVVEKARLEADESRPPRKDRRTGAVSG